MKNLYDLLNALPEDDAESLRAAFRKAVKANHPDNNPGDPDAPLRFRRIVRANAILSDERQREHYDSLLAVVRQQQRLKVAIAFATFSVALLAGYLLFGYGSRASLVAAQVIEVSARERGPAAAVLSDQPSDTIGRVRPRDERADIGAPDKPDNPEAVEEAAAPSATAPAENTDSTAAIANVPAAPDLGVKDLGVKDARYYRERGISAYGSGDLYLALTDFDLAIDLNPHFSDAYIDRSIVFYRMGDFKRAFADIARAKRIDDLNRSQTPQPEPRQTLRSSGKN
jgi:curved DNA-binding protein CbpA